MPMEKNVKQDQCRGDQPNDEESSLTIQQLKKNFEETRAGDCECTTEPVMRRTTTSSLEVANDVVVATTTTETPPQFRPIDQAARVEQTVPECPTDKNDLARAPKQDGEVVKYRQWLYDRCDGTSRYGSSRPPCFLCYVPLPVRWFADYLEQNALLEWIGRWGCVDPENPQIRQCVFTLALAANLASLGLTFFAALATTTENHTLLRLTSFTRGVALINNDRGVPSPDARVDIGLRAVALTNDVFHNTTILEFGEFCRQVVDQFEEIAPDVYIRAEDCDRCDESSFPLIFSLAIGMLFTFPNMTTNILRMWPNYDVNCQKFFGGVIGIISLLSSCYSWFGYTTACFNSFHDGRVIVFSNLTKVDDDYVIEDDNEFFFVDRDWDAGNGLIAIVVATLLKLVDILCNWIVPTPSITRDHAEQCEYEEMSRYHHRNLELFENIHQKHRSMEHFGIHHLGLVSDTNIEKTHNQGKEEPHSKDWGSQGLEPQMTLMKDEGNLGSSTPANLESAVVGVPSSKAELAFSIP